MPFGLLPGALVVATFASAMLLSVMLDILQENYPAINLVGVRILIVYFEKIRVFNAGVCREYISME